MLCKPPTVQDCVPTNIRPHQLQWGDQKMDTAISMYRLYHAEKVSWRMVVLWERSAYFGKLDIISHCKALWNGWQSSCRRYGKGFLLEVTCRSINHSMQLSKTTHYTTTVADLRSMGECRSEVFFTSPPNTKKGRSGCGNVQLQSVTF